jgi:hypothetical protein
VEALNVRPDWKPNPTPNLRRNLKPNQRLTSRW